MEIRFHCPGDGCVAIIEYEPLEEAGASIDCPRCGRTLPLAVTDTMRDEQMADQCAACGGREMFIRKDFPQVLGLAVVVIAGLSSVAFFQTNLMIAWGILAGAIVVDLGLYWVTGKLTTCYACRAEYRTGRLNPKHDGFDLATSEKY